MCRLNEHGTRRDNGYEGTHMGQSMVVDFGPYIDEPNITDDEIMHKLLVMRAKRQGRVPPIDTGEMMHLNRLAFAYAYGILPVFNPENFEDHELVTEEQMYQDQFRVPLEGHVWLADQREEVVEAVVEASNQQEGILISDDEGRMDQVDGEIEDSMINNPQNMDREDDGSMDQIDEELVEHEIDISENITVR